MDEKQYAVFCRKGSDVDELIECAASPGMQKTKTAFQVEKVVVLSDAEYAIFRKEGFMQDQVFLFENGDYMWFDPSESCWHCQRYRLLGRQLRLPHQNRSRQRVGNSLCPLFRHLCDARSAGAARRGDWLCWQHRKLHG